MKFDRRRKINKRKQPIREGIWKIAYWLFTDHTYGYRSKANSRLNTISRTDAKIEDEIERNLDDVQTGESP